MLKSLILILIFLVFFGEVSYAQEKCNKYSAASVGITFCAPVDWTIKKAEGGPFDVVIGPQNKVFTPNIQMRSFPDSTPLSVFVDRSIKDLQSKGIANASRTELVSKTELKINGKKVFKISVNSVYNNIELRSVEYVLKAYGDITVLVTATYLRSEVNSLESIIDDAVKTIKITRGIFDRV